MPREVGIVTGVVGDVYPKLGAFDVKASNRGIFLPPKATVHMILKQQSLPRGGATVTVKSRYWLTDSGAIVAMVVTPEDVIIADDSDLTVASQTGDFVEIVRDLKLTATDLLEVATVFDNLRLYFKSPHSVATEDLILSVLKYLGGCKFQLQFLRNMKFVDDGFETSRLTYKDFSYWTFGSHQNRKNRYLIGFLFFKDNKTGLLHFTDTNRDLPVIILKQERTDLVEFLNQYILIKEYNIITEIYNCPMRFTTLEYLLLDLRNVAKLGISFDTKPIFRSPSDDDGYKKTFCTILSKSLPIAISQTEVTYWLEVTMEDNSYGFLRLPTSFKDVFPFLQNGHAYHILYKTAPKKIWDKEILSLSKMGNSQKSVFILELSSDTYLIPKASNSSFNVCNVSEAFKKLNQNSLVSFEGVASLKLFNNPIRSRTKPATSSSNFGTPGLKTPKLRFETDETFFEVYLNNWENLTRPYALVPDMRVIVRNVVAQRGKYYKSTALTSFEVVNYEPKIRFETANLWDMNWSVPFYLGSGLLIPSSTVIYGRLLSFSILKVNIYLDAQNCVNCQINKKQEQISGFANGVIETNITSRDGILKHRICSLFGFDNFGKSKILAKGDPGLTLLRLLLRFHKPAFQHWCEGLEDLKEFTYSKDQPPMEKPGLEGTTYRIIYAYFKSLENNSFPLDLVCRKMDDDAGTPVYFLIDGLEVNTMELREN